MTVSPSRTSRVFSVHSSLPYFMNHWSSMILTTQLFPHLHTTGLSAKSYMIVAMLSAISFSFNSSRAKRTFMPPNSGIESMILPLLCCCLYSSFVASCSFSSFWSVIPNLSMMSAAGISPYPLSVHTGIGSTFSMIPSRLYFAIISSLFFKSCSAM